MNPDLLSLPRSGLLALWLAAAPAGTALRAGPGGGLAAIQGDDEPHGVVGLDALPEDAGLAELAQHWTRGGRPDVAALLPVPGDVSGLPPDVAAPAVEAGECLLVATGTGCWAAVPAVVAFGPVDDVGHLVTWQVLEVEDWRRRLPGVVGTLAEAELSLRGALRDATQALTDLDVARWRPDAATALVALRSAAATGWRLPSGLDQRALRVLTEAVRLRAIVALATDDDGGAVNLWQADQRSAALRHVDHAARRAFAAATLAAGGRQARTDR